jgi:hypothetical protein
MKSLFSFRVRARWLAFLTIVPLAAAVLAAVTIPACLRALE